MKRVGWRERERERDGWRAVSRNYVRKCWPGEMESGVVCLFWLSDRPAAGPFTGHRDIGI